MKPIRQRSTYLLLFFFGLLSCSSGGDADPIVPSKPTPEPPVAVTPPSKSVLSLPENNKTCETGASVSEAQSSVIFKWTAAANASTYDLSIINLNNQAAILQANITAIEKAVTLNKGIPYSWQVTSKATGTSVTAVSDVWKFYLAGEGVTNYAPFPATLLSPASGATVSVSAEGKITLTWEGQDPDADALKYSVFLDTVDGQQAAVANDISVLTLEVSVAKDTVYYWRVKSSDSNSSSFSQIYAFKTGA